MTNSQNLHFVKYQKDVDLLADHEVGTDLSLFREGQKNKRTFLVIIPDQLLF
jgi:hypothetical protein